MPAEQTREGRADQDQGMGIPLIGGLMLIMLLAGAVGVHFVKKESQPTHVVLIVLDTVRADRLGCYGHERPTTPTLDAFAAEGLRFSAARSTSPWTLPSHASMFTGLHPAEHGCTWENPILAPGYTTLAEDLAHDLDYETFAVSSNVNASRRFGLDQGFETFLQTWELREQHRGKSDSAIVNAEVEAWLDSREAERPFFLFLNYLDVHLPYTPAPPYDQMFGPISQAARELGARGPLLRDLLRREVHIEPGLWEQLGLLYDAELRQLDDTIGQLLRLLEERGLDEHTMIVITSDHGEHLGEEGRADHQLSMREELLRVPMLVRWPGRVKPGVIHEPVNLAAIPRWLREAAHERLPRWTPPPEDAPAFLSAEYGRPVDLLHFMREAGVDAVPHDRRRIALAGFHEGRAIKVEFDSHGEVRALDIDGDEEFPIADPDPEMLAFYRDQMDRDPLRRAFLAAPPGPGSAPQPGSSVWKELIALGYLSDPRQSKPSARAALVSVVEARDQGEFDKALRLVDRVLLAHPDDPDLLYAKADTLQRAGKGQRRAWKRFLEAAQARGETGERVRRAEEQLESSGSGE